MGFPDYVDDGEQASVAEKVMVLRKMRVQS